MIINWLFNDIWCYLFIACFDWKIGFFHQAVARVYYILKLSENAPLVTVLLKSLYKTLTAASEIDFIISGGMLLCVAAFLGFRSLISNSISINDTTSNLVILFLIREILGSDSNFIIAR